MLFGIVWGFLGEEGLVEIETCITDARTEATTAFHGFEDMVHGQWESGIIELLTVVHSLPAMSTDCHNISDDIATLEAWGLNLYQ